MTREHKFFNALRDVFVGAKVEGKSGYINLMRIKFRYYETGVFPKLQEDINEALKQFPAFRDELFEKLYDFFHRYFSESGSIYFRYTPLHQNVYEKVYTGDRDVMLFWKTHMLYYVKTDRLFRSLDVELDGTKYYFDVSTLEHKKANEKRDIVYSFKERRKDTLVFEVAYSERGRKTNVVDILRALRKEGVAFNEDTLERAFRVFEKQSEVDYFINKDAKAFLEEQFNLWLYQYVFSGMSEWTEIRIRQLQTLKDIAFKIIAFISQFENELVKIWNKPKFVLNSNYVITLDRIAEKDIELVEKLIAHKNFKAQIEEWQQLGIVDDSFKKTVLLEKEGKGKRLPKLYQHLPIDTKHFKDAELEILGLFDNLDAALDGRLIKSENYQALNTILPKFEDEANIIYIDPPYNTGDDEFIYNDRFQCSSWLSMMKDRLLNARQMMPDKGVIIMSIGREEVFHLEPMCDDVFGKDNQIGDLIWEKGRKNDAKYFSLGHDYLLVYAKNKAHLDAQGAVWREEKPGAQEILSEYRRLKALRGKDYGSIQEGIRVFYDGLPKGHRSLKYRRYNRVDQNGIWRDDNMSWPGGDGPRYKVIHPKTKKPCTVPDGGWRFATLEKFKLYEQHGFIEYREDHTEPPILKRYLNYVSTDFDPDARRRSTASDGDEEEASVQVMPSVFYKNQQPPVLELRHIMGGDVFKNPKDPYIIGRLIKYIGGEENNLVIDFFAGSGTTANAVIDLNRKTGKRRKYLLVEMADYCETVILPRIKKVVFSDKWENGKAQSGQGIHHFMKYSQLEQYEDALRRAKYDDADLFDDPNRDPFHQYVFLRDLKMLEALKVDTKKNKVKVDLSKLYDGIDIAETLSNLTGKWIKRITADSVEFDDGEVVDTKNLDWKRIKQLIWW